jgi:hypothetical protein
MLVCWYAGMARMDTTITLSKHDRMKYWTKVFDTEEQPASCVEALLLAGSISIIFAIGSSEAS